MTPQKPASRHVRVVGIGTGNPDHLTVEAVEALNRSSVIFVPVKEDGKTELADARREVCRRHLRDPDHRLVEYRVPTRRAAPADSADPTYRQAVHDWHDALAGIVGTLIDREIPEGGSGAFLVWGDPSLYDSTLRLLDQIREAGATHFTTEVLPGITSLQVLAARHRIPLNDLAEPFTVTTGRRLRAGLPDTPVTAVMLTSGGELQAVGDDVDVFWGAYLGTDHEVLRSGRLAEVADEIERTRRRLREERGWIMDTFILKRRPLG